MNLFSDVPKIRELNQFTPMQGPKGVDKMTSILLSFENIFSYIDAHNGAVTAISTIFIAIFTVVLALVTMRQARLSSDAIALAREEFLSSHRPKIRIKHLLIKGLIEPGRKIEVDIYFTNVGDSPAIVTELGFDTNITRIGAALSGGLFPPPRNMKIKEKYGLGETGIIKNIASFGPLGKDQYERMMERSSEICCFGFIEYTDSRPEESRKIHRTAFSRLFKPPVLPVDGIGRFMPLSEPDPDYDFED